MDVVLAMKLEFHAVIQWDSNLLLFNPPLTPISSKETQPILILSTQSKD